MTAARIVSLLLLAALVAWGVAVLTVFTGDSWRHLVDSAIYILCSQSLAAGDGYTHLGTAFFGRPPGLSVLLMPFVGPPFDAFTLNLIVNICAVGAVAAIAVVMRRLHGGVVGLAVALVYAVHPLTAGSLDRVLSEFPFQLLFFGGAALLLPDTTGAPASMRRAVIGAVLLAASAYFRSVAMLVLPGLLLAGSRPGGNRKRNAALAGLILVLYLPWASYTADAAGSAERPATQLMMFDYPTALLHTDPGDPESPYVTAGDVFDRIATNAAGMITVLGHLHFGSDEKLSKVAGGERALAVALAIVLGLAVLFTGLHRRTWLDVYLLCSMVLLFVFFTFFERLLLSAFPLVLSALAYSAQQLGELWARSARRPALKHGPLILFTVLGLGLGVLRFHDAHEPDRKQLGFGEADRLTAAWIDANLPADARILHEKGAIMTLLSGRTTFTDRNLPGPWPAGCPQVDWALYGPRPTYPESSERAVERVSRAPRAVPMPWFNKTSYLRAYQLPDD